MKAIHLSLLLVVAMRTKTLYQTVHCQHIQIITTITTTVIHVLDHAHIPKPSDAIVSVFVIVLTSCCLTGGNSCTDGNVRLVDGSLDQEGRVEVCVNGVWGSVCGHGWSSSDGRVVCKQLGYPDSSMIINHTVILMILLILTSSQRVNQWEIWGREWAHFLLRCELSGLGKQFIPVRQNLLPSIHVQL